MLVGSVDVITTKYNALKYHDSFDDYNALKYHDSFDLRFYCLYRFAR